MSSRKRDQASSDSEYPSDGGSESAGSTSPPQSRKRTRFSASPSFEDSDTSDRGIRLPSPRSDDALLNDEDELELRQTQIIQEKYAHLVDEINVPAEHGILERVECYNFMCHDHFSVELGPLITFIVGKNGSGKSAILTGITLCLGGKASATNRGQSLKSFIKEGKENASIIVRIKNQGDGAYMPEDYGKSIIVERHFSKSGSSGFKIKGENGRIVSTKKAELDSITDYFSLQIDNPMNVLSQDMARQFLSTSSPAEKYKFFVKGVQLEQLDQDYRLIEESIDQIEEKLRIKAQDIRVLENRKDAAKKKLEISDQHDSLRERIRNLRGQMAWAQVEDQERARDSFSNELAKADEQIANAEAALGQFDDAFQAAEEESETAADHAHRADTLVEEARGEKEKMKEKLDEEMSRRHDLQAEQRQIKEYYEAARARMTETQEKIDNETQRLAEISDGGYARKKGQCERAAALASAARIEYEEHGQGVNPLKEDVKIAERDADSARKLIDAKEEDINQANSRLRNLTNQDGQRQTGFSENMPSLLKLIRQERSFTTPPVGPLGHYITLLEPKWASVLENTLGGSLNSFVVTCKKDMNLLSGLMRRTNCNSPIYIGNGGEIDVTGHEPHLESHQTALKILKIENPVVQRQLIINHGVEQMLLIENLEEASSVLFDGDRPRNVKRCFCIDTRDRRRGIHLSYNRNGEPSQAPVPMYQGHPRMKSDLASQISTQREVIQDLKRQLNDLQEERRSADAKLNSYKQELQMHHRKSQELKINMQRMEDEAESLRDALDKQNAQDGQLDALQAALQEAEADRQLNEGSLNDSRAAMTIIMESLKVMRREMSAKDHDISKLLQNSAVAEEERKRVEDKRRKILNDKSAASGRIEDYKRDRERIRQKWEEAAAKVLDYNGKASIVSERVPVDEGETTFSLDQKLERLHRDLERYNQQLGASREEIAAEAGRTEIAYQRAMNQVNELTTLAQIFKDTLDNRKKRWEIFRSHISSRAKAQFTYLLSERSFRGRLLANHNEKLLDLQVEPDITKDDSTGRGAKTLSGGEKSFSQVCLLLALWEAMGSPVRCLDEFDVYMDHINRKMAIDMLMIAARRSIGRQFILITPGSKTDITISSDVRVVELAEPERGQTTLNFHRS